MSLDAPAATQRTTISGVEAIVQLLLLRRELDLAAGLNTATLISGYPGSPLGGLDLLLAQSDKQLEAHKIVHRPGVNEELALAAAWGSQMGAAFEYAALDGVVGAWYGKTPGLDRSGDVVRHANAMGAGPNGGLVLFCGDDPSAKSSTLPCDSQYTFQDACVPVLYPCDQQDLLTLGLHAFMLSRVAGPLVGMKVVTTVADGIGTVELAREHYRQPPSVELSVDGQAQPWRHTPLTTIGPHQVPGQELLIVEQRLAAARAYVRAHGLDRVFGAGPGAKLGIVASGKSYLDVMQALADLGVPANALAARGLRVLKLAMTYPLVEPTIIEFAQSVDMLLVIEEKRPFIETQLRAILHEARNTVVVLGKRDASGRALVQSTGELDASQVAEALARALPELGGLRPVAPRSKLSFLAMPPRPPAYCSGCPHNRSTLVPPGALVGGGVGCHGIMYFEPRQRELHKLPPPPMGAEGAAWIGLAPFVKERHLIQNLGDGTLSHSGILAVRASVAAGVNVTFKILYNAAVAMTGGQAVAGLLDVPALTRELEAEGVKRIVVCADHPDHYAPDARWATGVEIFARDKLLDVQTWLREVPGVSAIIFDQRCAAEARRLRRRGLLPTPKAFVVINEAVCEGCGDCQTKSNCASVVPHPTELGEKRRIDELTCNRDYTCLDGDCPSFVTITPRGPNRPAAKALPRSRPQLPEGVLPVPPRARVDGQFGVYFTGIGGTGVITAARILTQAAQAAGMFVNGVDQTGLAQRGGAVVSHIHFAYERSSLGAASVGTLAADLYLSGDLFQAADAKHLAKTRPGRTIAAIDRQITQTAAMRQTGQAAPELADMQQVITGHIGAGRVAFVDSQRIAEQVFSQHVLANVVLLGAAFQLGGLPFELEQIEAGLAQRGAAAEANRAAFTWGRWVAHDPERVTAALDAAHIQIAPTNPYVPSPAALSEAQQLIEASELRSLSPDLRAWLERRAAQVIDYQNVALARKYLRLVERACKRERPQPTTSALTRGVAAAWFKLITYKDEYEVARLHNATQYDRVAQELGIDGPYDLKYHLHPPTLRRLGMHKKLPLGVPYKLLFALLPRLKRLRGTPFDIFGWDADRRLERAIMAEYRALMLRSLADPTLSYAQLVELAESALSIKGYGAIKERAVEQWRVRVAAITAPAPALTAGAAE